MLLQLLQWIGCLTGILGSLLLAWRSRWSGWGFAVYILSNACWLSFGLLTETFGMVMMQLVFMATSVLGVWKWLLAPQFQLRKPG